MGSTDNHNPELDRALGALLGGALGDALGMPTQSYSRIEIADIFGAISDFKAPVSNHPIAHGLAAASVTDDTEQTLLLAEHILASPEKFDEEGWAHRLLDWENSVKERGLYDLLGPSTIRALEALFAGTLPRETGRFGNTNGAAMRIVPVGISTPVEPMSLLTDMVETTCRITHNTVEAIASASAVAAAISSGIDGAGVEGATEIAIRAARTVEKAIGDTNLFAERLVKAIAIADRSDGTSLLSDIDQQIGTSVASAESVPADFALFKHTNGDAWNAGLLAANLGGDTDTIGAIAAGMCGAISGVSSLPQDKLSKLIAVNDLKVGSIAEGLLNLRHFRAATKVAAGQAT
ncbi:MAG: ADP-ribosylglycohydrolase family protein [Hyphomicrobiales bacterium]|nr:ADP-ribosylglycohydrolase family protein [Hyphomicrobiales bacterium]MCP4998245.1 ADP-ribosylglycohydrolase family protein [Hyphomicrobiales bacterium]